MKEVVAIYLSGKEYGVDVSKTQGLENYREMWQIEGMPEQIIGMTTIRDEIYPVMDVKKRLVLPEAPLTNDTKYMIFRTMYGRVACIIDGVSRIIQVEGDEVQPFPDLLNGPATNYADYIVKKDNSLVLVIDPAKLVPEEAWIQMKKVLDGYKKEQQRLKEEEIKRRKAEEEAAKAAKEAEEQND